MSWFRTYLSGMRQSVRPVRVLRSDRLWEIDTLRGIAIVMMIIYHFLWDLRGLAGYPINVYSGFWHYFQITTASLFIGLVGISMTLSDQRARSVENGQPTWPKHLLRGLQIFSWGVVISIITYLYDPGHYIRFGILHLIGLSIILAIPFLHGRWSNLVLGIIVIALAELLPWGGIPGEGWDVLVETANPHPAFDYFPIIPWFGVALIGIFVGNLLYAGGRRRFSLPQVGSNALLRGLRLMGQNSLLIYLLHQPVMITILILSGVVRL